MRILIRPEEPEDIPAIHNIVTRAFTSQSEPALVDRLREEDAAALSVVAEINKEVVGHVLFSPMTIENNLFNKHCFGLAPLAVKPELQHQGIGSKLVRFGLERSLALRWDAVFVLGSAAYYHRFGFTEAGKSDLFTEYEVPSEDFMVLALNPRGLDGCSGLAIYHTVFKELGV
jgi:putative acetyltransferase